MQRNSNWIAYTRSLQEAQKYRVEDQRDTAKFCKDERKRARLMANWSRINMYTKVDNYYLLPIAEHRGRQRHKEFNFDLHDITLHEHQSLMVDFVDKTYKSWSKSAFIIAGTGTGKTYWMLAIASHLGMTTVIVSPNSTVSQLIFDDFSKYVDTKIIKWSKNVELTKVNIMTHQTFNKIYDQINWKVWLLLMDEAHHIPTKRVEQINKWKWAFVCWLTATAIRKEFWVEGFEMLFWSILDTETEALPMKLFYHDFRYDYNQDEFLDASEWLAPDSPELYRRLVISNELRNEELVNIIDKFISNGKKYFIVFSDRVEHIINTSNYLKEHFANVWEYRWDSDKERVIREFNKMGWGIIVWNLQSCWEWFNIKKLEVGILYVSTQRTVTCEQAAGRVRRSYWDKTHGIFVDFVDNISFNWSKTKKLWRYERKKIYAKKWWDLNYI